MLDHDARSCALIVRIFNGQPEGLTRDDILDNVTLDRLTNTAVSSAPSMSAVRPSSGVPDWIFTLKASCVRTESPPQGSRKRLGEDGREKSDNCLR